MPEQYPQTGLDVVAHTARRLGIDRRFGPLDPLQQDGGDQERDGVDGDGARRRDELHEQPRDTRSARLRGGIADLELAVALDHRLAPHQGRHVGVVRYFKDDTEHADEERHDEELLDA